MYSMVGKTFLCSATSPDWMADMSPCTYRISCIQHQLIIKQPNREDTGENYVFVNDKWTKVFDYRTIKFFFFYIHQNKQINT